MTLSFTDATPPAGAEPSVKRFKAALVGYGLTVASGVFAGPSSSLLFAMKGCFGRESGVIYSPQ
ncbi:MAG TPA: hypothetical protein VKV40_07105 [Ktedonobacteraceae bacterium]|nr:hypothetical protein [Ktedonobacteraceae bacterium]